MEIRISTIVAPDRREDHMKSTARLGDHPIHPMLIPYPFAFLSGALAFRVLAATRGDARLAQTADHLRTAGLCSAVVAAVPGIIDYLTAVPEGPPMRTATSHALSNSSALVFFGAAAWLNAREEPDRRSTIALEALGTACLSLGGWLGGKLSYHHHVGVLDRFDRAQHTRLADA
jgi:uncharacterized membrane protein